MEEVAELAEGSSECGELLRGGCLFAWKFIVIRSTLLMETERTRPNMIPSLHY